MVSIVVPDNFALVLLCNGVLPSFTNFYLSTKVMTARKKYSVQYPNLYATPGYHKQADEFNRVQRGHQNNIESISDFRIGSLIAGLYYPNLVAVCGVIHCIGSVLYMAGYSDTSLDVKTARLMKGGPIKVLAGLVVLFAAAYASFDMCKSIFM